MSGLPRGWAEATLDEICEPIAKHNPSGRPNESFTYIDIGGIESQRIVEVKELLCREAPSRARQLVREGDTVLSTVRTYLCKTALVPMELDGATASTGFCVLRPAKGIEPAFLFHRVTEAGFVTALSDRQTGSSYPAVRDVDVFSRRILLPPSREQSRIVATIDEQFSRLDAAEESLRHAKRTLDALRAVTLAVATDGFETIELGALVTELRYGTSIKCSYDADGPPVLRIPNIQGGKVDLSDLKFATDPNMDPSPFALDSGDLLLVRTNGSRDLIGRVARADGAEGMAFASYLIRARPDHSRLDSRFAAFALATPASRALIEAKAATSAGQYNLNLAALRSLPVPIPPIEEQRSVVTDLERRLSITEAMNDRIESALSRSAALRRSILAQAFTGKLASQNPSDESASLLLERIAAERAAATKPPSPRKKRIPA